MTITQFLLARIADDEAVARDAFGAVPGGKWMAAEADYEGISVWADDGDTSYGYATTTTDHIARHDPARVLAECAAKRAIVELAEYADEAQGGGAAIALFDGYREVYPGRKAMLGVLPALASVYAEHPDYDAEWSAK